MGVRLGAALAGVVVALAAVPPAHAARFSTVPPGFVQEKVADFTPACSGAGPSGAATDGSAHYFAVEDELQKKQPNPPNDRTVRADPYGVAVAAGRVYATTPGCNARPPALGEACNVVQVAIETGSATPVAEVCGTAITASPDGSRLAVATENEIVVITTGGAEVQRLPAQATALAWMGSTIFFVRPDGGISSTARSLTGPVRARSIAPGTAALGLENRLVVATDTGLSFLHDGRFTELARSPDVGPIATSGNVILAAKRPDAYVLRGRYMPESPPPPPVAAPVAPPPTRPAPAPPRTETIARVPRTPAPPPLVPAPAPPPVPPAPPAPLPVFVAQQSPVANPAMVPGQEDPEAAYRLAATRAPRATVPTLVWLALATGGGAAAFAAGSASRKRRHAPAEVRV